jgi:monovalent cation/hydrogen antiporter
VNGADALLIAVVAVIAIAVTTTLAQRLRIAGPLLLVAVGIIVSLLPFVHVPEVSPEIILVGVLPPLLYSAAVNLPAIEFRRDFRPIAGLAVVLVVISSVVLGVFFWLVIPAVTLPLGIALGAILSPTDAVATSIAKRLGIAPRVITMLEGESLLNDATALVLLRTAIVAIAGGFSFGSTILAFVWGVVIAVVIGGAVGWLLLRLRELVGNTAAATAISFTTPFLAYIPTEHLNGSGLVAAVVAGAVTAQLAPRRLNPEQRLSDRLNWSTIELVLEGAVFLLMGLEIKGLVEANNADHEGLWYPTWLALSALGIILVVRTAYVSFLVWRQGARARRMNRSYLEDISARIEKAASGEEPFPDRPGQPKTEASREKRLKLMRGRVSRTLADIDYYQASPLGWKHGAVIVWAGMRGVVTLAAAQTLTLAESEGHRALLVFIAFLVALASLLLQGLTLPWAVRMLRLERTADEDGEVDDEQSRLDGELAEAGRQAISSPELARTNGEPFPEAVTERVRRIGETQREEFDDETSRAFGELRIVMLRAMRVKLGELASGGAYSSAALRHALAELDADQLSLELRLGGGDDD